MARAAYAVRRVQDLDDSSLEPIYNTSQRRYLARRCLEAHWPDFAEPSNALGKGSGTLELTEPSGQVDVGARGTTSPRLSGHDLRPGHQRNRQ